MEHSSTAPEAKAATNGSNGSRSGGRDRIPESFLEFEDPIAKERQAILNESMWEGRRQFFNMFNDQRRDIDFECGYPKTTNWAAESYYNLYEREPLANRVCSLLPKECWVVSPKVFEDHDEKTKTPFEMSWAMIGRQLLGGWYKDEKGSPFWEICRRADEMSRIGSYGVILIGVNDGGALHEPVKDMIDLQGNIDFIRNSDGKRMTLNEITTNFNPKETYVAQRTLTRNKLEPDSPLHPIEEQRIRNPVARKTFDGITFANGKPVLNDTTTPPLNSGEKVVLNQWIQERKTLATNALKKQQQGQRLTINEEAAIDVVNQLKISEGKVDGTDGYMPFPEIPATDQQYFGSGLGAADVMGYPEEKEAAKVGDRKLTFLNVYPEHLAQIVRFEWNSRSSRWGKPVMYRITLNDPREAHAGVGLPLNTVYVHWTRVIHIAPNLTSSKVFGVPEQRPVLNALLDARKVRAAAAEAYWKNCMIQLSFETHPQLGGDVAIDKEEIRTMMDEVSNGLQRFWVLSGMGAKSIAPSVSDPNPQMAVHIEAICIQKGCPVRVFKGAERGELASTQDDADWNGRLAHNQNIILTPGLIAPLVDRLIAVGILEQPKGYYIEWPDLDSLSDKDKAQIGQQRIQSLGHYMQSGVNTIVTPIDALAKLLMIPEKEAQTIIDNAMKAAEDEADSTTSSFQLGKVGGVSGILQLFTALRDGTISQKSFKSIATMMYHLSDQAADDLIADTQDKNDEHQAMLGDQQDATTALTKTQALQAFLQGGLDAQISPVDYLTIFMGFEQDEAEAIIARAEQAKAEKAAKDAVSGQPPQGVTVPPKGGQQQEASAGPPTSQPLGMQPAAEDVQALAQGQPLTLHASGAATFTPPPGSRLFGIGKTPPKDWQLAAVGPDGGQYYTPPMPKAGKGMQMQPGGPGGPAKMPQKPKPITPSGPTKVSRQGLSAYDWIPEGEPKPMLAGLRRKNEPMNHYALRVVKAGTEKRLPNSMLLGAGADTDENGGINYDSPTTMQAVLTVLGITPEAFRMGVTIAQSAKTPKTPKTAKATTVAKETTVAKVKKAKPTKDTSTSPIMNRDVLGNLVQNDWVTLETGQHVYLSDEGEFLPSGPKSGDANDREQRDGERGGSSQGQSKSTSSQVAGEAKGSSDTKGDSRGDSASKSASLRASKAIPLTKEAASAKIDRMANFLRSKGDHEIASYLDKLKEHVNSVGTEEALKELGGDLGKGDNSVTQYEGKSDDMSAFAEAYLNRHGITPLSPGGKNDPSQRLISGQAPSFGPQSRPDPYLKGDFNPKDPKFKNKLEESQHLPGLESSEDMNKLFGKDVTHLTKEVTDKLDKKYGKDQWIVKAYGEDAFAGHGIHFPQRARQLEQDAKSTIWASGQKLAEHGFSHLRNDKGDIIGVKNDASKEEYKFMTQKYHNVLYGDVKEAGNAAFRVRDNEKGAALLSREGQANGKDYMVQPAFNVVGVTEADRAAGRTIAPGEARVHLTTKNGEVSIIPHATWVKGEHLPVVFENEDTKAMTKAASDAIKGFPHHERDGQIYAADVLKTDKGYKVIEANPANETGSSGYLSDNPFIIDSYVSHLTGRTPAHVRFIKQLLTKKTRNERRDVLGNLVLHGGPGSGNFGHEGRPGEVGGSSSDSGGGELAGKTVSELRAILAKTTDLRKMPPIVKAIKEAKEREALGYVPTQDKPTSKVSPPSTGDKFESQTVTERLLAVGIDPNQHRASWKSSNPLGYSGKVSKEKEDKVLASVKDIKAGKGMFQRPTIKEIHDKIGGTIRELHEALYKLYQDKKIDLEPFTQALKDNDAPKHLMPLSGDYKFYVTPKGTFNTATNVLGLVLHGGPGSGNFGHAGIPGQVGGSSSEVGSDSTSEKTDVLGRSMLSKGVAAAKAVGAFAGKIEHAVIERYQKMVAKLPTSVQKALHLGGKALFASYTAVQAMAEQVGKERGLNDEQSARLRAVLSTVDVALAKPTALMSATASFLPVASTSYVLYSTARNPLATIRAAKTLVKDSIKGIKKKVGMTANEAKPPMSDEDANAIADFMEENNYSDWAHAVLAAALDETDVVNDAIEIARKAMEE